MPPVLIAEAERLDEQVQTVAVGVPSWRGGTDEGGRECLVGMAPSALGSSGRYGNAKTKMLLPMLGRSSGVSGRKDIGLPVPVLATTYCRPSTA